MFVILILLKTFFSKPHRTKKHLHYVKPLYSYLDTFDKENETYYKRRQAIVEHPYGTIKRQWGFSYIMTKKYIHRAKADVGLVMIAYNLRRIINIMGIEVLKEYLEMVVNTLIYIFVHIRHKKACFKASGFSTFNIQI